MQENERNENRIQSENYKFWLHIFIYYKELVRDV